MDASVALDRGSNAAPLLALLVASRKVLRIPVYPFFDFRDRLQFLPEVLHLRLGIVDRGWVQFVESIEKTAKVVV